ncbi:hypothetical protein [Streptomyces sp. NPDC001137]|uniref:hypothetical protein n=1 Tax=Streptomyces sp. NPDC001137 TaxID=3154378 RepID=UPI00332A3206
MKLCRARSDSTAANSSACSTCSGSRSNRSHGYDVLDMTPERSQMTHYILSDNKSPTATASWTRSYRTCTGTGTHKVERVDAPVL